MKLNKALKEKNRLVTELNSLKTILGRENSRRTDSTSTVDCSEVYNVTLALTKRLIKLKGNIARANVGIYHKIEEMSELKARITFIQSLNTKDGKEVQSLGYNQNAVEVEFKAFLKQEDVDKEVQILQEGISKLQDEIDEYNAATDVISLANEPF